MQEQCQNGIDYDECDESVDIKGATCSNCCEKAYESYLEGFYGGSSPIILDEQMREARKLK